jgi:hypothetical protein
LTQINQTKEIMNTFKTFKSLAALFMLSLTFAACSNYEIVNGNDNGPVEVRFSASTAEIQTRVSNDSWTINDPVGIYMIDAAGSLIPEEIIEGVDNRQYKAAITASNTPFIPVGGTIYYPMNGDVEFIAYHPYQTSLTDFRLPFNVAQQNNQSAIDVLYASKTNGNYNKNTTLPVNLTFQHKLVKLDFSIFPGTGITEPLDGLTVKITGQQTTAELDLTNGTVTTFGGPEEITANTSPNGASSEAIVLPNNDVSGMMFTFTTGAGTYEVAVPIPTGNMWESGKKYTYDVTLKRNEVIISGSVNDWIIGDSHYVEGIPQ